MYTTAYKAQYGIKIKHKYDYHIRIGIKICNNGVSSSYDNYYKARGPKRVLPGYCLTAHGGVQRQ